MPMSQEKAQSALSRGDVVAVVVVPQGFLAQLKSLLESPTLTLETSRGAARDRVLREVQSVVFRLNLRLQRVLLQSNIDYLRTLVRGGSAQFLGRTVHVLGLQNSVTKIQQVRGTLAPGRSPRCAARRGRALRGPDDARPRRRRGDARGDRAPGPAARDRAAGPLVPARQPAAELRARGLALLRRRAAGGGRDRARARRERDRAALARARRAGPADRREGAADCDRQHRPRRPARHRVRRRGLAAGRRRRPAVAAPAAPDPRARGGRRGDRRARRAGRARSRASCAPPRSWRSRWCCR